MSGYSYTTIRMEPGESPRVGVSIYPDETAMVRYFPSRDTPAAFIGIDFADSQISIGLTRDTTVTDVQVKFARELVDAAAAFLAGCERLRDERVAGGSSEQATPGKAA
ncbi:hypothetical protein [Sphaerisporangium fuscum]|uniref:hypothetical protein n=1 Tax=Sphaerisporangium fuscum TaxID=2835868 RepID=UPI001BDD1ACB|nr:hypothetical protein [Sphaerisporangium fuscum]